MKTSRILLIILAILIILPLFGRLLWELKKSHKLDIVIINKTVPVKSQNELKGLNWVLNINKYIRSTNYRYNYRTDYYGYHPDADSKDLIIKSYGLEHIDNLTQKNHAIFFVDTKGVDIQGKGLKGKLTWFGGLDQNDYLLIKSMRANNKLVFAESNFLSEPTESLVRFNTEQFLDIYYLGWKGRYIEDLFIEKASSEISEKWTSRYKEYSGKDWNFQGPGIVLINEAENRIIIVPSLEFTTAKFPVVKTKEDKCSAYCLPANVSYKGWFYFVHQGKNDVISEFDLNLNEKGIALLHNNGLSSVFPAVIASADKRFYFMAGDFSKSKACLTGSKVCIITPLLMSISGKMTGNPDRFFQTYYSKLLSSILNNYYTEIGK